MDTSSINKLNRYRATLDAITAKDYNENHGPDGRFESGSSSAGSKENKAAKSQIFKAATKGARKTAAAKKKKEKSEARRTLKNLEKESQQSREDRIKAYMKEKGASREKAENYVAKQDIFRSAAKSSAESKLAKDFNENHDPGNGRFTSGGSGSTGSTASASKNSVSTTSTKGKITQLDSGHWYAENDNGSSVDILDLGKEDYNIWKYGSKQVYEVQQVDSHGKWGDKIYCSTKSEAMSVSKKIIKELANE